MERGLGRRGTAALVVDGAGRKRAGVISAGINMRALCGKKLGRIGGQHEVRRHHQLVEMAMIALLVNGSGIVHLVTAGRILVVGQELVEICFWRCTYGKHQQQPDGGNFLYDELPFQIGWGQR